MGRPKLHVSKEEELVTRGLDPRSLFPRCDFCSKTKSDPGSVQLGRWWGHTTCVAHPDNLQLFSAKLPAVDYSVVKDRFNPRLMVMAMLQRIRKWRHEKLAQFREDMHDRGDDLLVTDREQAYE